MNVVLLSLNASNNTLCYSFSWLPLLIKLFKESCNKCTSKRPCHKQIWDSYIWIASSMARKTESRNPAAMTWRKKNIVSLAVFSYWLSYRPLCCIKMTSSNNHTHTIKYWGSLMKKNLSKNEHFIGRNLQNNKHLGKKLQDEIIKQCSFIPMLTQFHLNLTQLLKC